MKTIKNNSGEVKRVDDATARNLVDGKLWFYCPKNEWKEIRKTQVVEKKEESSNNINNRGLSDKNLRKERRRAKSEKNQSRG